MCSKTDAANPEAATPFERQVFTLPRLFDVEGPGAGATSWPAEEPGTAAASWGWDRPSEPAGSIYVPAGPVPAGDYHAPATPDAGVTPSEP